MAQSIAAGSEREALRLAFQFVERYDRAPAEKRPRMVEDEPGATGDPHFDALIAAIVEFLLRPMPDAAASLGR
jgi:hypothetical protein